MNPPEVIGTDRLVLRRPVIEDAEAIFSRYAQDADVTKYLTWRPHKSIETTRDFLRVCSAGWKGEKWFQWVVEKKEDYQLMGMVGIRLDGSKTELGYVLAKAYWGREYMTEAARAIIGWVLDQEGVSRVWSFCDVENYASARVLEKVGMQREGVLKKWIMHPSISNELRDCYSYAITK